MFKLRAGRKIITRAVWSVGLAGLCGLLLIVAKAAPEGTALVFGPWSRWVSGTLGWVFSFTKLAVAEWLLYALVVGLPLGLLSMAFRALRRRSVWPLLTGLSRAALGAVSIGTAFFLLWGLNYFNPPLAGRLTVEPVPRSVDSLYATAVWVRDEMNRLAPLVPRDEAGVCQAGGFDALAPRAVEAYRALAAQNPVFDANPAPPKTLTFSELMSRVGLAGIYVPFTGEAIVNADTLDAHLPFSLCHEMAHRMGFAPEDEANYVAFLATSASSDPVYQYSAYHLAFIYCANALAKSTQSTLTGQPWTGVSLHSQLWAGVAPEVMPDFAKQTEHIKEYEGPLQQAGEAVNDKYLQTVGQQEEGIESYGLVVDLLIAEYVSRFGDG